LKNAGNKLEQQYKNRERRRRKRGREREEEEHSVKFKVGWLSFFCLREQVKSWAKATSPHLPNLVETMSQSCLL
jgi:pyrroloquinoline quinone (PQQ) biosynthesis protein C